MKLRAEILRVGKIFSPLYGEIEITEDMLKKFAENFKAGLPAYKPPVNIEHMDHLGSVGVITNLEYENGALFAEVEFSEEGAELVESKKFRYFSPEFVTDYIDKNTGQNVGPVIVGLALTNKPANPKAKEIKFIDRLKALVVNLAEALHLKFADYVGEYKGFLLDRTSPWDWDADVENEIIEKYGWKTFAKCHMWVDPDAEVGESGVPEKKGAYKFPFAKPKGDKLVAYFSAIKTIMAYLNGARQGVNLPRSEKEKIYKELVKWYKAFGIEEEDIPEAKFSEEVNEVELEKLTKEIEELKQKVALLEKEKETLLAEKAQLESQVKQMKIDEIRRRWWDSGVYAETIEVALKLLKDDLSNLEELNELVLRQAKPNLFKQVTSPVSDEKEDFKQIAERIINFFKK